MMLGSGEELDSMRIARRTIWTLTSPRRMTFSATSSDDIGIWTMSDLDDILPDIDDDL